MDNFIYTAARGATLTMESQAIKANNLANANTIGFRADFDKVKTFKLKDTDLDSRWLPQLENGGSSQAQGSIKATNRDLDAAIVGNGMFAVMDQNGNEAYTRDGEMAIDSNGNLTISGKKVIGNGGVITIPQHDRLQIDSQGRISISVNGGRMVESAKLKLVSPKSQDLQKGIDGLFHTKDGLSLNESENVSIQSGALEDSNVNAVQELVASMDLGRQFEMQVKLMACADKMAASSNSLLRNS